MSFAALALLSRRLTCLNWSGHLWCRWLRCPARNLYGWRGPRRRGERQCADGVGYGRAYAILRCAFHREVLQAV